MDAESAIRAHKEWKDRLRMAMATREPFDLERVASDKCCDFGKWLHGDGRRRFGFQPAYATCIECHARFHAAAADVAQVVNQGKLIDAERMLAHGTPYAKASEELVQTVTVMFKRESMGANAGHTD